MRVLLSCAMFLVAATSSMAVVAEQYPDRPIKLVVGYPPGGTADAAARHLGAIIAKALGQSVVIENRGGAAGSIAAATVARAAPDGYTLLYGTIDLVMYPALHANMAYHPLKDFATVIGLSERALVLAVQPALKVRSVQELVALAKANPGELAYESSGVGSVEHLAGEIFQKAAGITLLHVPYKGSGPAIIDMIAGRVQMGFEVPLPIVGHIKEGKLIALLTTGAERLSSLPQVPTAYEVGMPGLDLHAPWAGIFAPAGTPTDRILRINAEFAKARNAKEIVENAIFADSRSITGSPEQFEAFVRSEYARWAKVVKEAGIEKD